MPDKKKTKLGAPSVSTAAVKLPKKLERDTIIEAIFEIRFSSNHKSLSDILPGIIYQKHSQQYPNSEKLPISQLPQQFFLSTPDLRYQATTKLAGEDCSLLIGNHVLTVSKSKPYEGWDKFKERIKKILVTLQNSNLIDKVERASLRYTNLLPNEEGYIGNKLIRFEAILGKHNLANEKCSVRTEFDKNECLNIVQLKSHHWLKALKARL